jgi:hypothetical protein
MEIYPPNNLYLFRFFFIALCLYKPIAVWDNKEVKGASHMENVNATPEVIALTPAAAAFSQNSYSRGPVSSDDPDGIEKLEAQLADRQRKQQEMKEVNKLVRKKDSAGLLARGYSEAVVRQFFTPDFCGRLGFPAYEITNNNSSIKRIEGRIAELKLREKRQDEPDKELVAVGYTYREDKTENRAMFIFPGKPSEEIRSALKSRGFKWSPTRDAWVRLLNGNAEWAATALRAQIDKLIAA